MLVQAGPRRTSPAAAAGIQGGTRSVGLNTGEELLLGGDVIVAVAGRAIVRRPTTCARRSATHEPGEAGRRSRSCATASRQTRPGRRSATSPPAALDG